MKVEALYHEQCRHDFDSNGYTVIKLPATDAAVKASFNDMPRDGHSLTRLREIRLNQYLAYCEAGEWIFSLLPKRKYIQSSEYIKLAEAGGVFRHREQMQVEPSHIVSQILAHLPVDRASQYQINVNQIRVTVNSDFKGITVPEGPHRDGHDFSVIAIVERYNVSGGETQVIDPQTNEILFRKTLEIDEAILINDERYIHYASNIAPLSGNLGWRDIWVIEISKWEKRQYGPLHDMKASGSTLT